MRQTKALDSRINTAWRIQASGVEVSMTDIPKIFAECKAAVESGHDLSDAIASCIARYRKN